MSKVIKKEPTVNPIDTLYAQALTARTDAFNELRKETTSSYTIENMLRVEQAFKPFIEKVHDYSKQLKHFSKKAQDANTKIILDLYSAYIDMFHKSAQLENKVDSDTFNKGIGKEHIDAFQARCHEILSPSPGVLDKFRSLPTNLADIFRSFENDLANMANGTLSHTPIKKRFGFFHTYEVERFKESLSQQAQNIEFKDWEEGVLYQPPTKS